MLTFFRSLHNESIPDDFEKFGIKKPKFKPENGLSKKKTVLRCLTGFKKYFEKSNREEDVKKLYEILPDLDITQNELEGNLCNLI